MGELVGDLHPCPPVTTWAKSGKTWTTCAIPDEKKLYAVDFGICPPEHEGIAPASAWLDTSVRSTIFGKASHSCDPNCEVIDGRLGELRGVFVINTKPIKAYDELTFDYGGYYRDAKFGQTCAMPPELCTCRPEDVEEEEETEDEEMEDVEYDDANGSDEDDSGEYTGRGDRRIRNRYFV